VDKLVAGLLRVSHCSGVARDRRSSSAEGNLRDPQSIKHVRFPYLQGCNARTPALGPQYPAKGSIFELCGGEPAFSQKEPRRALLRSYNRSSVPGRSSSLNRWYEQRHSFAGRWGWVMANDLRSAVSKQDCDIHKNPRQGATTNISSSVLRINQ
jgi:hypothetical protein